MCAYQGIKNVSFLDNFAYVLNKWSRTCFRFAKLHKRDLEKQLRSFHKYLVFDKNLSASSFLQLAREITYCFNQCSLFDWRLTHHAHCLTLSWRRPLSYRNNSIDLRSKSMDWFLYGNGLRHERVKQLAHHWTVE